MSSNRRRYEREDCKTPIIYSEYRKTDYCEATMYDKSAGGVNFESNTKIQSGLPVCIIMPSRTNDADAPGTHEAYIAQMKWYQQGVLGHRYKIGAKFLFQGYMYNSGEVNKDCGSCKLCDNKLFGDVYLADESLRLCQSCFKYLGRAIEDCAGQSVLRTKMERQLRKSKEQLNSELKPTKRRWTEEKLEEAVNKYKTLFDNSPDGLLAVNIETKRFMYANPQICRLLGYTEEELKQMSVTDIHF